MTQVNVVCQTETEVTCIMGEGLNLLPKGSLKRLGILNVANFWIQHFYQNQIEAKKNLDPDP